MIKNFKPMLLSNDEYDLDKLDYSNMVISRKRDGIRIELTNEGLFGRSLKKLRNVNIQNFFAEICNELPNHLILEAEIYADGLACRDIAGICNSLDKEVPENMKLYIFGVFDEDIDSNKVNFEDRLNIINQIDEKYLTGDKYAIVEQIKITSSKEAKEYYNKFIEEGFEGAVIMDTTKPYKKGRVTIKQHIGFKMKPQKEIDLEIIDVTQRFLNTNESEKNELGNSFKRNTVDNKKATGISACFICKYKDTTTKVTITGDEEYRREVWKNKDKFIGRIAIVRSMSYGEKDKLRHSRLLRVKEKVEY